MGQVTGALFLGLTAAYDTVWHTGFYLKIQKAIFYEKVYPTKTRKTTDLVVNLLHNRSFVLLAGGEASKPYKLKNGVAQGSILAPTLYNIYASDFQSISCKRYLYADDMALTCSEKQISVIEHIISNDLDCVSEYNRKCVWNLQQQTQFLPFFIWKIILLSTSYKYTFRVIPFSLTLHII